jgi:hypothetical protein
MMLSVPLERWAYSEVGKAEIGALLRTPSSDKRTEPSCWLCPGSTGDCVSLKLTQASLLRSLGIPTTERGLAAKSALRKLAIGHKEILSSFKLRGYLDPRGIERRVFSIPSNLFKPLFSKCLSGSRWGDSCRVTRRKGSYHERCFSRSSPKRISWI